MEVRLQLSGRRGFPTTRPLTSTTASLHRELAQENRFAAQAICWQRATRGASIPNQCLDFRQQIATAANHQTIGQKSPKAEPSLRPSILHFAQSSLVSAVSLATTSPIHRQSQFTASSDHPETIRRNPPAQSTAQTHLPTSRPPDHRLNDRQARNSGPTDQLTRRKDGFPKQALPQRG